MNLPNKLSLLRIAMIPLFVIFALLETRWAQITALVLFVGAAFTDLLDGRIARRRHLITDFGKFVDPIADKLLTMAAFVVLVEQGRMPAWMCILVLGRELAVSGFRLVAVNKGTVLAAGWLGKIKTVLQMAAIVVTFLCVPPACTDLLGDLGAVLAKVLMYACTIMTVWSGADYIWKNFHLIREM